MDDSLMGASATKTDLEPKADDLRVEYESEKEVGNGNAEQGDLNVDVRDLPLERNERRRHDPPAGNEKRHEGEHGPEASKKSRQLLPDCRVLDVLFGRRPALQKTKRGFQMSAQEQEDRGRGKRRTIL